MTVNYFENCSFLGKCSILWQTEAFLCYCRKENYNSSGLTLAEEGMGGNRLAILMWRVGQGLSSPDRRPLEGTKGENCDILLSLSAACCFLQLRVPSIEELCLQCLEILL